MAGLSGHGYSVPGRTAPYVAEPQHAAFRKVKEEVEEAHDLFKDFIRRHRPTLDVDAIATGETWFGTRALEKGLVDELKTSDECIVEACEQADVYLVRFEQKKKLGKRLGRMLEESLDRAFLNWMQKSGREKFFS